MACRYPDTSVPFVEKKSYFFPIGMSWYSYWKSICLDVWLISVLSVLLKLISMPILIPIPHCLDYYNSTAHFCSLWVMSILQFYSCFKYSGYLAFPYEAWTTFWKVNGRGTATWEIIGWNVFGRRNYPRKKMNTSKV